MARPNIASAYSSGLQTPQHTEIVDIGGAIKDGLNSYYTAKKDARAEDEAERQAELHPLKVYNEQLLATKSELDIIKTENELDERDSLLREALTQRDAEGNIIVDGSKIYSGSWRDRYNRRDANNVARSVTGEDNEDGETNQEDIETEPSENEVFPVINPIKQPGVGTITNYPGGPTKYIENRNKATANIPKVTTFLTNNLNKLPNLALVSGGPLAEKLNKLNGVNAETIENSTVVTYQNGEFVYTIPVTRVVDGKTVTENVSFTEKELSDESLKGVIIPNADQYRVISSKAAPNYYRGLMGTKELTPQQIEEGRTVFAASFPPGSTKLQDYMRVNNVKDLDGDGDVDFDDAWMYQHGSDITGREIEDDSDSNSSVSNTLGTHVIGLNQNLAIGNVDAFQGTDFKSVIPGATGVVTPIINSKNKTVTLQTTIPTDKVSIQAMLNNDAVITYTPPNSTEVVRVTHENLEEAMPYIVGKTQNVRTFDLTNNQDYQTLVRASIRGSFGEDKIADQMFALIPGLKTPFKKDGEKEHKFYSSSSERTAIIDKISGMKIAPKPNISAEVENRFASGEFKQEEKALFKQYTDWKKQTNSEEYKFITENGYEGVASYIQRVGKDNIDPIVLDKLLDPNASAEEKQKLISGKGAASKYLPK